MSLLLLWDEEDDHSAVLGAVGFSPSPDAESDSPTSGEVGAEEVRTLAPQPPEPERVNVPSDIWRSGVRD